MTNQEIKHLLQRFYDGTSTDAEEQSLRQFFATAKADELDAELVREQQFFSQLFDDAPAISAASDAPKSATHPLRWLSAAAACFAVFIALSVGYGSHRKALYQDTFTDPDVAYQKAEESLEIFANAIDKGMQKIDEIPLFNE